MKRRNNKSKRFKFKHSKSQLPPFLNKRQNLNFSQNWRKPLQSSNKILISHLIEKNQLKKICRRFSTILHWLPSQSTNAILKHSKGLYKSRLARQPKTIFRRYWLRLIPTVSKGSCPTKASCSRITPTISRLLIVTNNSLLSSSRKIWILLRKHPSEDTKSSLMQTGSAKLLVDGPARNTLNSFKVIHFTSYCLALKLYGKDWKKVEEYIGTRTGA